MDAGILTPLVSFALSIAVLSVMTAVLTIPLVWLTHLQANWYFYGLKRFLIELRQEQFEGEGLKFRPRVLKQLAREEVLQLMTGGPLEEPPDRSPVVGSLPWRAIDLKARIEAALSHPDVMADLVNDGFDRRRAHTQRELIRRAAELHRGWMYVLFALAGLIAFALAYLSRFSAVELFSAVSTGEPVWLNLRCTPCSQNAPVSAMDWAGFVLSAWPAAWFAARAIERLMARLAELDVAGSKDNAPQGPIGGAPEPESTPIRPIGRDGDYIRAINFSSGGFDTLMHLGVIHALVVIQGRAPDVVTGLSAGAVHAAALAEVLQAGEEAEKQFILDRAHPSKPLRGDEKATIQRLRLLARVERLRTFIEAAHRAPERLLEAVLPDAFQIDVGRPLFPLQQPTFSQEERAQRAEFVSSQSGLAALYNDVLRIPLSIGTMTRIARRVLGIIGAGAIRSTVARAATCTIEGFQLWLLLGLHLGSLARLLPVFGRAFRQPQKPLPGTASSLIFRSRTRQALRRSAEYAVGLCALAAIWVIFSTALYPLALVLAVPFAVVAWRTRDDPVMRGVSSDAIQGLARGLVMLMGWMAAAALVYAVLHASDAHGIGDLLASFGDEWLMPYFKNLLLAFSLALLVVSLFAWGITTHRWSFMERLLAAYNLGNSLLESHGLQAFISELFDRHYYAKPSIREAVKAGLEYSVSCRERSEARGERRSLSDYASADRVERERIHVALAVANTETGLIDVVPPETAVVDGIMAATAVTPLLPPVELPVPRADGSVRKVLYVDAANVVREPTHALLEVLRSYRNPNARCTYIYSVEPFPISKSQLGARPIAEASEVARSSEVAAGASQSAAPREGLERGDVEPVGVGRDAGVAGVGGGHAASQLARDSSGHDAYFLNLVGIVWRAWRLRRFRDATLERRLTELFSAVIPSRVGEVSPKAGKRYVRAWVTPIELEYDADLNNRLARATKDTRRTIIERTLADGCRAALQVMIPDAISAASVGAPQPADARVDKKYKPEYARCTLAVQKYFADLGKEVPEEVRKLRLPGSAADVGPGLSEICASCRVYSTAVSRASRERGGGADEERVDGDGRTLLHQTLRLDAWETTGPTWPHELEDVKPEKPARRRGAPTAAGQSACERGGEQAAGVGAKRADEVPKEARFKRPSADRREQLLQSWQEYARCTDRKERWPRARNGVIGRERATVNLLFSGGVFRGVFQVGVLNGLHELGIKPDLIAGASVGTITAAMIARAFTIKVDGSQDDAKDRVAQQEHIAWLAATYLGIDRLVLTDRFADFIRNITVRASETRFSIREADRVFRKYDYPDPWAFNRDSRRVIAGLERLFYMSPYQLNELVRALRTRASKELFPQLAERVQQFLDRMQIGEEALGAEPLRALVDEFGVATRPGVHPAIVTADDLRRETGIQFLATATNLTRGSLEVLGEMAALQREDAFVLNEALFASSAFPGVFRPRWSWELSPATGTVEQYIDGGVMDNFPVDAIAGFLHRAGHKDVRLIARVPRAPHLVVAASLEVTAPRYSLAFTRRRFRTSWIALRERAKQLGYNAKLDTYCRAERSLREIDRYVRSAGPGASGSASTKAGMGRAGSRRRLRGTEKVPAHDRAKEFGVLQPSELVHLTLLPIKPNWLCGTFAFHPMLQFRREKQARSIAHGCAATLLAFAKTYETEQEAFGHWGIDAAALPRVTSWAAAFKELRRRQRPRKAGFCWLRDRPCPFSREYLSEAHRGLPLTVVDQVAAIYEECTRVDSHLREV